MNMIATVDNNTYFGAAWGGDESCYSEPQLTALQGESLNKLLAELDADQSFGNIVSDEAVMAPLYDFDIGSIGLIPSDEDAKVDYYGGEEMEEEAPEEAKEEDLTQYRVWTDSTGAFTTLALFRGLNRGLVRLLKPEGERREGLVKLERLSVKDRELVERFGRKDAAGGAKGVVRG